MKCVWQHPLYESTTLFVYFSKIPLTNAPADAHFALSFAAGAYSGTKSNAAPARFRNVPMHCWRQPDKNHIVANDSNATVNMMQRLRVQLGTGHILSHRLKGGKQLERRRKEAATV